MEEEIEVIVKPTWRLAWGLWWRQLLIGLVLAGIIIGIPLGIGVFMLGPIWGF